VGSSSLQPYVAQLRFLKRRLAQIRVREINVLSFCVAEGRTREIGTIKSSIGQTRGFEVRLDEPDIPEVCAT
jgi:hypothetical protein